MITPLTLKELMGYLKSNISCPFWRIGKADLTQDQSITLYNDAAYAHHDTLGGRQNAGYRTKRVAILIHWGDSPDEAERKALQVYNVLDSDDGFITPDGHECYAKMPYEEPVYIGTSDDGKYEYVINVYIYYM